MAAPCPGDPAPTPPSGWSRQRRRQAVRSSAGFERDVRTRQPGRSAIESATAAATLSACCRVAASARYTTNSLPPSRATTPRSPPTSCSRRPIWLRTTSPGTWPRLPMTSLTSSRSAAAARTARRRRAAPARSWCAGPAGWAAGSGRRAWGAAGPRPRPPPAAPRPPAPRRRWRTSTSTCSRWCGSLVRQAPRRGGRAHGRGGRARSVRSWQTLGHRGRSGDEPARSTGGWCWASPRTPTPGPRSLELGTFGPGARGPVANA